MTQVEQLADFIVRPNVEYSASFPEDVPCKMSIHLGGGQVLRHEKRTYPGFVNSPLPWAAVEEKFHRLADVCANRVLRDAIVNAVANLDQLQISEFDRAFWGR